MVDKDFMQKALDEAWLYQGLTFPNPPVGAVIVEQNNTLISIGVHKKAGFAHAELDAVKNALNFYNKKIEIEDAFLLHEHLRQNYKDFFKNHSIYVTLEPCNHYGKTPPCSLLLKDMGFKRVVISVKDPNKKASGGIEFLNTSTSVEVGLLQSEGEKLITLFKIWQEKKPFVFFKVAVSKNWVYSGGIISSQNSRKLVHQIREITDLLVIGGETVRVDRPTLDTRLSSGKNPPDVLILSKRDDFDKNIPLFSVKDRKVIISDDINIINNYNFVMVEGGEKLFKLLQSRLDAVMIFQSQKELLGKSFKFANNFVSLNKFKFFDDTIEWKIKNRI